jgi:hypothetical protein
MAVSSYIDEKSPEPSHTVLDNSKSSSITASFADDEVENSASEHKNANYGSTQQHVFSDPSNLSYWTGVYEAAKYEGCHRFNALLQWSPSEEKRLVRKVCPPYICWRQTTYILRSLIFELCFGSG